MTFAIRFLILFLLRKMFSSLKRKFIQNENKSKENNRFSVEWIRPQKMSFSSSLSDFVTFLNFNRKVVFKINSIQIMSSFVKPRISSLWFPNESSETFFAFTVYYCLLNASVIKSWVQRNRHGFAPVYGHRLIESFIEIDFSIKRIY